MRQILLSKFFLRGFCLASLVLGIALEFVAIARFGWAHGHTRYYLGFACFNLAAILFLLFFKPLVCWINSFLQWVSIRDYARERWLLYFFVLFFIATYTAKIHWGFWWQGIPGWTMPRPEVLAPKEPPEQDAYPPEHFLWKGINKNVAKYYHPDIAISTDRCLMFMHFKSGEILPMNYGIFSVVFPNYVFGTEFQYLRDEALFARVLKRRLERKQEIATCFLLPSWLGYPEHAAYTSIQYDTYPPARDLIKVSCWAVTITVYPNEEVIINQAVEKFAVDY